VGFGYEAHYWLARELVERGIAACYLVAFISAALQFSPLLGEQGLLPTPLYVKRVKFRKSPSLFHLYYSDRIATALAWGGAALAGTLAAGAQDAMPLWASMTSWLVLWATYLSFVNVGQIFYAFGWESLLLEAGFLAAFLGNAACPPPPLTIWLYRWLLFRLEFGAGLIKMRGDRCWRQLTCLYYHHETQPLPGPLSWYFHRLPRPLHKVEAFANHFAQLLVPWALFAPQPIASAAGVIITVTQLYLVISGNYSWLNWLTIFIAASALADGTLGIHHSLPMTTPEWFSVLVDANFCCFVVLSWWPARNLVRHQLMNYHFNPLHLANAYGAFGTVTKVRYEVVIEGTDARRLDGQETWQEIEFKAKPGNLHRRPRQVAPYHLRLDWLMWFAALSRPEQHPWFFRLLEALLRGERTISRLLANNPFREKPPTHLRARLYVYRFTSPELRKKGQWWERDLIGEYLRPVKLSSPATRSLA